MKRKDAGFLLLSLVGFYLAFLLIDYGYELTFEKYGCQCDHELTKEPTE